MEQPYILFCAGEDSGDILGEAFVAGAVQLGYRVVGSGGRRMQSAGLEPLVDFDLLPVSGFGDVLPKYFQLRSACRTLREALESDRCLALVCIDYPGFNMRLCARAKELHKPVLYVAPPQVWAWKRSRGKKLRGVNLAVLFDFEKSVYEGCGCVAQRMQHPFLPAQPQPETNLTQSQPAMEQAATILAQLQPATNMSAAFQQASPQPEAHEAAATNEPAASSDELLLLPGSRRSQALRNLQLFLSVALSWRKQNSNRRVKILVARQSLLDSLKLFVSARFGNNIPKWISFEEAPQSADDRRSLFQRSNFALSAPGTATLELALSGTPLVVATVPDSLTYLIGSALIHTRIFSLPNILLDRLEIPEFILAPWKKKRGVQSIVNALEHCSREISTSISLDLQKKLAGGVPAMDLIQQLLNTRD